MGYTVRTYKHEDAGSVKELILSILTKEYPFDRSAYSDSDLDKIGEVYGGQNEDFFVIEEDGAIVGTVGVKQDTAEDALMRRLFVNTLHRKKGYGTELLRRAVGFCRQKGYRSVYFRCTGRMRDAMRLCIKEGFKEIDALEVSGFKIHKLRLDL